MLGLVWDDSFQFRDEQWKVFSNGIPTNVVVDNVVAMDTPVAHADDLRPGLNPSQRIDGEGRAVERDIGPENY